jgi:hypothetical protein
VLQALHGFTAYRSDSNIDFTRERLTFFDFTFWAYPVSQWQRVVTDFIAFCAKNRPRFRPALFTEVYFICADDRSRLAFAPREHVFTLDMVHNEPNNPEWHALNEAYNEFAVSHGARPLLNQTKRLPETPHVVGQGSRTGPPSRPRLRPRPRAPASCGEASSIGWGERAG